MRSLMDFIEVIYVGNSFSAGEIRSKQNGRYMAYKFLIRIVADFTFAIKDFETQWYRMYLQTIIIIYTRN